MVIRGPIGCIAKIDRAQLHIATLRNEVELLLAEVRRETTQESLMSADGRRITLRAHNRTKVDPQIAVIAGEVVHQLRSSLDHLLYELVRSNGQMPNTRHQFPICTTRESYAEQLKRGRIRGVSDAAEQLIELAQPFQGAEPEMAAIQVLSDLNNWDKHNALVVSVAAAQVGAEITIGPPEVIVGKYGGKLPRIENMPPPDIVSFNDGHADFFYIEPAIPDKELTATAMIDFHVMIEIGPDKKLFDLITLLSFLTAGIGKTITSFY